MIIYVLAAFRRWNLGCVIFIACLHGHTCLEFSEQVLGVKSRNSHYAQCRNFQICATECTVQSTRTVNRIGEDPPPFSPHPTPLLSAQANNGN